VSGTVTQNLRFPGQYFDSESGWNHNGFRDYIPELGRYAEPDPLGNAGSGPNLYPYVFGNPINLSDPLGLKCECSPRSGKSQIPYRFVIAGKTDITAGNVGFGSGDWWWYRLENSSGEALTANGYSVEEHITPLLDRGMQIGDNTSEGRFIPVVDSFTRDTVGLNKPPGANTYMDQRVTQWFTVKFKGCTYDLTTEFEHRTSVDNGKVRTYVW
jgi:RHS repeat-associated protein